MTTSPIAAQVPHFEEYPTLAQLEAVARDLVPDGIDTSMSFDGEHYVRRTLFKNQRLEIAAIWFSKGQTSSVHDHRGSSCVVRVLRGKILETLFARNGSGQLDLVTQRSLSTGQVSGLDGWTVHNVANLDEAGSVLLNVYSPPFA